jgi:phosphoglycerate dehydrogenase-like enzyme
MHAALLRARPDLEVEGTPFTAVTDAQLAWADTYVGFKRPPQATSMGHVRWVHCTGAGVDAWLAPPPLDPQILLTRTPESFGPMIAEWVVARCFAFQQQLLDLATAQAEGRWAPRDIAALRGTRALLIGTGDVGSAVARALHGLGVRVTGVSRSGQATESAFESVHPVAALSTLLGAVDWVVLTLPDTPETRGLFSASMLAHCRGAVLLNAGRGSVLDETALLAALRSGALRGAALDVFAREPLDADSPLWRDARVMISPHISGLTTVDGAVDGFLECLDVVERGLVPRWAVDRRRGY